MEGREGEAGQEEPLLAAGDGLEAARGWDAASPELLRGFAKGLEPAAGEAAGAGGASQGLKCKFLHFILGGGVKVCPFLPLPRSPQRSGVLFGRGLRMGRLFVLPIQSSERAEQSQRREQTFGGQLGQPRINAWHCLH